MNRAEKTEMIESFNKTFTEKPHLVLAAFKGLTVNQVTGLRQSIHAAGGEYKVIKNRLAKRAAVGTPVEGIAELFKGPCAIAYHADDPVALAKALANFSKDNPEIQLLAGIVDARENLDADGVTKLSKLPGLQELQAQLLALFNTPATTLVRLIGTPATQLARVIDTYHGARNEESDD